MSTIETSYAPPPTLKAQPFGAGNVTAQEIIDITPAAYLQKSGWFSRLLSLVLLVVAAPVIVLLIAIVRITSRGAGLYQQVRVGKNGKIFVMYKIRSMVVDAEVGTGPVWTQGKNDPRITRIGWLLRKSHLDELPQLLNVVRGEMSLFGPRPERPEMVHILADSIPGYWNRLSVRPGITGLAQINLPPDTDIESVRRKLKLDLDYVRNANLWMEVRMFVWTGMRLFGIPSSLATKAMALGRNVAPVACLGNGPVTIEDVMNEAAMLEDSPH